MKLHGLKGTANYAPFSLSVTVKDCHIHKGSLFFGAPVEASAIVTLTSDSGSQLSETITLNGNITYGPFGVGFDDRAICLHSEENGAWVFQPDSEYLLLTLQRLAFSMRRVLSGDPFVNVPLSDAEKAFRRREYLID